MAIHYRRIADYLRSAFAGRGLDQLARLKPRHDPSRPRVPGGSALTEEAVAARWALPDLPASARDVLADSRTLGEREAYARNIENFIGTVKMPVGLAGPLRVNGAYALGDPRARCRTRGGSSSRICGHRRDVHERTVRPCIELKQHVTASDVYI